MNTKPVAVLGTGPAGLMAAHAVALSGRPVALFGAPDKEGKPRKSKLGGAQFLHDPIPFVCDDEDPDAVVTYRVMGTPEGYAEKVYGPSMDPSRVSMNNVHDGKQVNAWNLIKTYDRLWDLVSADSANVQEVTPTWLDEAAEKDWFELVLSTIPAHSLCRSKGEHNFFAQEITIANESMHGVEGEIWYSGLKEQSWYRSSKLWGHEGTEWGRMFDGTGNAIRPVLDNTFQVAKPLHTNCDCNPDVVRLGRYGTWTKGVLTNHAFVGALKAVMP